MKEPITGRDLFVISTLCTGFGVLFAWGLFYHWGSAPQSKPFDAPAWVQAVGSVMAILVAIAIPAWQRAHQRADEQRAAERKALSLASSLLGATKLLLDEGETLQQAIRNFESSNSDGERYVFQVPAKLIEFQPELHNLGEPGTSLLKAIYYSSIANDQADHNYYIWRDKLPAFAGAIDRVVRETQAALSGMHELLR